MSRDRLRIAAGVAVVVLLASGCGLLLGISDVPDEQDAAADASPGEAQGPAADAGDEADADAPARAPADAGDAADVTAAEASPCGDTRSTPTNCGHCGHDCLGGQCSGGACQPIALVAYDAGATPWGLAQDDAFLYWTDNNANTITRTDKKTGDSVVLYLGATFPYPIAVDDAGIYWGDTFGVSGCTKASCAVNERTIANGMAWPVFDLAVDGVGLYWIENGGNAVLTAPKTGLGAGAQVLWSAPDASIYLNNVASDGQRAYFTAMDGWLRIVAVDGGAPLAIGAADTSGSGGVALSDGGVYWSMLDPSDGAIYGASTAAPTAAVVTAGQHNAGRLASDGTNLYWLATDADGGLALVAGCSIAACNPSILATGYRGVVDIVVDSQAIYWTEHGVSSSSGALWKLAK